jgi:hypothetical protein
MLITEKAAQTKWCPFVRIEGANRLYNTHSDGFQNTERMYHCIGSRCMSWRALHLSHMKGGGLGSAPEPHGYCGLAGRPDPEQGW